MDSRRFETSGALWRLFHARARSWWERLALSTTRGEMTFRDLFVTAEKVAAALGRSGVHEGSVMGLVLPNSLAFVPAFLALCKLDATVAMISPKYGAGELHAIRNGVRPDGFLTTTALATAPPYNGCGSGAAVIGAAAGEELALVVSPPGAEAPPTTGVLEDTAVIKFSSGSTGVPKGIALTAANLMAEARNVAATLALTPEDRILAGVPLFHSYGFDLGVLAMLVSGTPLLLRESFVPRRVLADLSAQRVTVFLGVPAIYRTLVDTPLASVPDLFHVRYLMSCTAPLSPELISAFHQRFRVPICQHYGSSETGGVTTHVPAEVLRRPTSVGLPMNGVEVEVVNEKGEALAPGMEGEVVVRSAAVARGYLMGMPVGDSPFRRGAYWTGDLGVIDDEGFLHLRGRRDTIINVGGLKVSPQEVVQVLEAFPAVREAAVVGLRNAMGEELVYAVVTLRGVATEAEILAFCRTRLADYKVPRRIEIRAEMPRTPSGKITLRPEHISP